MPGDLNPVFSPLFFRENMSMLMVTDLFPQNQQRSEYYWCFALSFGSLKLSSVEKIEGNVYFSLLQADGFDAVARVGVAADHRGIVCSRHVFRIVQHWLHAGEPDPFYDPLNDYVILPTLYDIDKHCEKHGDVTSVTEDWEIISQTDGKTMRPGELPPMVSTLTTSREGKEGALEEAQATVVVHPEKEGRQHVEVRAVGVSHGG